MHSRWHRLVVFPHALFNYASVLFLECVFDSVVHGRVFGVAYGGQVTEGRDVDVFVEGRSASMHANSVVVQEILQVIIIPASLSS
jgi:predicted nucleotidyltransferase